MLILAETTKKDEELILSTKALLYLAEIESDVIEASQLTNFY